MGGRAKEWIIREINNFSHNWFKNQEREVKTLQKRILKLLFLFFLQRDCPLRMAWRASRAHTVDIQASRYRLCYHKNCCCRSLVVNNTLFLHACLWAPRCFRVVLKLRSRLTCTDHLRWWTHSKPSNPCARCACHASISQLNISARTTPRSTVLKKKRESIRILTR